MSLIKVSCPELLCFGYVLNIELTLLRLLMPVISRKHKNSDLRRFAHVKLLQAAKMQDENNFFGKGMNGLLHLWCQNQH